MTDDNPACGSCGGPLRTCFCVEERPLRHAGTADLRASAIARARGLLAASTAATVPGRVLAIVATQLIRLEHELDEVLSERDAARAELRSRAEQAPTIAADYMQWTPHDPTDPDPVLISPWDRWIEAHPAVVECHAGRYVAIHPAWGIVASETTQEALCERLRAVPDRPSGEVLITYFGARATAPAETSGA